MTVDKSYPKIGEAAAICRSASALITLLSRCMVLAVPGLSEHSDAIRAEYLHDAE